MTDFFLGQTTKGEKLWRSSKYKYVDLRGKIPGNAQPSQGTVYKDAGVVLHWNGPKVVHSDIDQLYIDARYHIQKNWGGGYYTNGIQYEWAVGSDGTKYRLRNPGASLWHCGNSHYNARAFAVTFLFGEGQHATKAAKESMDELCGALLDIQGLSRAYMKGHLDVSASACPGTAYPDFVLPFRKSKDFGTDTPAKPKPQPTDKIRWINYVYSPDDGWGRKIATAMAEAGFAAGVRGGLTERAAKAAADAREQAGVYTFLIGSAAVRRAKRYQREFTDKDIAYNTSGAVRVVTPSYRDRAKWRIADLCEEFKLDKGAAIEAFEHAMGKNDGGKGGGEKMSTREETAKITGWVAPVPNFNQWAGNARRLAIEIWNRFGVEITTYARHGAGDDSRTAMDCWVCPEGSSANAAQRALGNRIWDFVVDAGNGYENWNGYGVSYMVFLDTYIDATRKMQYSGNFNYSKGSSDRETWLHMDHNHVSCR